MTTGVAIIPAFIAVSGDEKTEFDVILKSAPLGNTVQVIKLVSTIKNISLAEAKIVVHTLPAVIAEATTAEKANGLIESFRALGAVIDIK